MAQSLLSTFSVEPGHLYFKHHIFLPWRDFTKEQSGIVIKLLGILACVGLPFGGPYSTTQVLQYPLFFFSDKPTCLLICL